MSSEKNMETICLKHDNGVDMEFRGRLFSECSWYDEENAYTLQKLYVTDNNEQVYYIVRKHGDDHSRHAYRLAVEGESCRIFNGTLEISLDFDSLMLAVRGICGMADGDLPTLSQVGDMLKAANT
ncbi:MAG: hypothetical protein LBR31_06310 [Desulfovibrio sp.]|nr:hypothetical protein [Desulfovibrio sp.]